MRTLQKKVYFLKTTFDLFNGMRLFIRFLYSFSFGAFIKCAELIKLRGKKCLSCWVLGDLKATCLVILTKNGLLNKYNTTFCLLFKFLVFSGELNPDLSSDTRLIASSTWKLSKCCLSAVVFTAVWLCLVWNCCQTGSIIMCWAGRGRSDWH